MKNTLIIGGEGYIGSVLTQSLIQNGYFVRSLDLLLYQNKNFVLSKKNNNYIFIHGDMIDSDVLFKEIENVNSVILLAGLVGDPITKKYPKESAIINDDGIKKVIDCCAENNTQKFVFVSTCSNYGLIKNEELANENHELSPLSLYAKSKVNAENYILSLKDKTDMNPTIMRFATAFGLSPRMRFDLTVSEFTRELALGV